MTLTGPSDAVVPGTRADAIASVVDLQVHFSSKEGTVHAVDGVSFDILDGETRNTIANHNLIEVVRSTNREFTVSSALEEGTHQITAGRLALEKEVLDNASTRTAVLGIEILDGLAAGDLVLTAGMSKVSDGMKVRY